MNYYVSLGRSFLLSYFCFRLPTIVRIYQFFNATEVLKATETNGMKHSKHALVRMQQRSFKTNDLDVVMQYGTESKDGYILRKKDVARIEGQLRTMISTLHRLEGKYVVAAEDTFVTCYHPTASRQKQILRDCQCK